MAPRRPAAAGRTPSAPGAPAAAVTAPDAPSDAHEWVSFEDPDEDRTWVFDVTFLLSSWTCIFGAGCQGVLTGPAPELVQGCCSYGAHFTGDGDVRRVRAAARTLTAAQWQFKANGRQGIIHTETDGTRVTRLVDDACIFLNRPGFEGGPGCALHRAAVETGRLPLELKPDVCWQLPLRREDSVGANGHVTTTVTQWDRTHWGDGGQEFHWWCTEAPEAFVGRRPVYLEMGGELVALVGPGVYEMLAGYLRGRASGSTPLPHPALKARPTPPG
ncbi:hypothetical protein K6U06_09725 [Acidiferrimicrobium sp. IK]|uniref:hypothetical protein n=1 Tax=Acidiferrimicrobium sp. IK TaxID=2871700 RepID=UPI0021CB5393|nr:hypothetical protein [Acidiferrimicrobium sp. IK]MCU4184637.1 hypothetical protein [Acidiferrimicrobium sp. IK]